MARWRKRRVLAVVLAVLAMGLGLTAAALSTSTYPGRWVWWNRSDIDDLHRFPSRPIPDGPSTFRFAPSSSNFDPVVALEREGRAERVRLDDLARETGSTALLVVRRDTLLFEGYYGGHGRDSLSTSFSVAKSVTGLLAGIAIGEGLFETADDPVTEYLPELAHRDPRFRRVTLRHLLEMRSGIAFRDHDLPWGDKARAYYEPHLRKRVLGEIPIAGPPGVEWSYNTYNPMLVGLALERASGESVASFTSTRLWYPLGMEYPASWSTDGTTAPMEKMESGLNARAVDFAKIGRLLLERGAPDGRRVVSERWIEASTRAGPGCELESFRPVPLCYRLGWWITPPGDGRRWAVEARGHLGQYISVFPEERLVMVRFGREPGGVSWPSVFQALADATAP
ncbi:MAG: serine hydrolase [Candidatus Palauibacterales bacterium]|nr:serine hydrolase [Candidatus Palauibacterales bacterium]